MMTAYNNSLRGGLRRIGGLCLNSEALYVLAGFLVGFVYISYSWEIVLLVLGATVFGVVTVRRPEYSIYLLFGILLMTTDAITDEMRGTQDIFAIREIDIPGVPAVSNLLLLVIFSMFFFKHILIDKRTSRVSFKYLFIYVGVLIIALATGMRHPSATADLLRLEFMKMLLPVLCFYLCVNVFDEYAKIQRMMWFLFWVCVVKASILNVYYLLGKGYLFGDFQIVSYDSAELMAFIVLLMYVIVAIAYQQIRGVRAWCVALLGSSLLFAIVFSFRRAHWLGMLGSMGLLYFWSPLTQRRKLKPYFLGGTILTVAISCFLLLANVSPAVSDSTLHARIVSRFSSLFDADQSSNRHHFYESIQVMRDIMGNPIVGLGLASEHSPVDEEAGMWVEETQPLHVVHNTFLYMWMKTGFLGFLCFIWCCYRYLNELIHYVKNCQDSPAWPLVAALGSTTALWFAMFMTGPVPYYFHLTYLIALFSALTHSLVHLHQETCPNKLQQSFVAQGPGESLCGPYRSDCIRQRRRA